MSPVFQFVVVALTSATDLSADESVLLQVVKKTGVSDLVERLMHQPVTELAQELQSSKAAFALAKRATARNAMDIMVDNYVALSEDRQHDLLEVVMNSPEALQALRKLSPKVQKGALIAFQSKSAALEGSTVDKAVKSKRRVSQTVSTTKEPASLTTTTTTTKPPCADFSQDFINANECDCERLQAARDYCHFLPAGIPERPDLVFDRNLKECRGTEQGCKDPEQGDGLIWHQSDTLDGNKFCVRCGLVNRGDEPDLSTTGFPTAPPDVALDAPIRF